MVGPGVANNGIDPTHVDRPHEPASDDPARSSASKDDYTDDGHVLVLGAGAIHGVPGRPLGSRRSASSSSADEQTVNAPFGEYSRRHAEGIDVGLEGSDDATTATS